MTRAVWSAYSVTRLHCDPRTVWPAYSLTRGRTGWPTYCQTHVQADLCIFWPAHSVTHLEFDSWPPDLRWDWPAYSVTRLQYEQRRIWPAYSVTHLECDPQKSEANTDLSPEHPQCTQHNDEGREKNVEDEFFRYDWILGTPWRFGDDVLVHRLNTQTEIIQNQNQNHTSETHFEMFGKNTFHYLPKWNIVREKITRWNFRKNLFGFRKNVGISFTNLWLWSVYQ